MAYTGRMRPLALAAFLALAASAARAEPVSAIGTWRGQSLCTLRPSACKDEVIVYRFARGGSDSALVLTATKIVDGREAPLGVVDCSVGDGGRELTCATEHGVFRYRIDGRTLSGTLTLTDGRLFRRISATRAD